MCPAGQNQALASTPRASRAAAPPRTPATGGSLETTQEGPEARRRVREAVFSVLGPEHLLFCPHAR